MELVMTEDKQIVGSAPYYVRVEQVEPRNWEYKILEKGTDNVILSGDGFVSEVEAFAAPSDLNDVLKSIFG